MSWQDVQIRAVATGRLMIAEWRLSIVEVRSLSFENQQSTIINRYSIRTPRGVLRNRPTELA
jgi:hypothetical protein